MIKKENISPFIFAIVFFILVIMRWDSINIYDRIFYCLAVVGFIVLGIGLSYRKRNN